jgi:hypothetical protein
MSFHAIGPKFWVTITVEGERVSLIPKRAPVGNSRPIRGRTLAIVDLPSGAGPRADRVEMFRSAFPSGNLDCYSATIEPDHQGAIAVCDVTRDEALTAGRRLGMTEILFWDGRRAALLSCSADG